MAAPGRVPRPTGHADLDLECTPVKRMDLLTEHELNVQAKIGLPAAAVDDVVERPPVGILDRGQRPAGRVAE
jgi:hypothetical protein